MSQKIFQNPEYLNLSFPKGGIWIGAVKLDDDGFKTSDYISVTPAMFGFTDFRGNQSMGDMQALKDYLFGISIRQYEDDGLAVNYPAVSKRRDKYQIDGVRKVVFDSEKNPVHVGDKVFYLQDLELYFEDEERPFTLHFPNFVRGYTLTPLLLSYLKSDK